MKKTLKGETYSINNVGWAGGEANRQEEERISMYERTLLALFASLRPRKVEAEGGKGRIGFIVPRFPHRRPFLFQFQDGGVAFLAAVPFGTF